MATDTVSTLNNLIETLKDGKNGFETAASDVKDPSVKQVFQEYAQERSRLAGELQNEVRRRFCFGNFHWGRVWCQIGKGKTKTERPGQTRMSTPPMAALRPMVTTGTRLNARWLALVAATAIVLYLCWLMLQPFVDVLLWASVLAMIAWPVQRRLRREGYPASVSAMLTTVLVVLVLLIPLTLVTTAVVKQGAGAVDALHDGMQRLMDPNSRFLNWLDQYVDVGPLRDPKVMAARLGAIGGAIANRTLGIVGGVVGGVVQVFIVLFTLYYLLRDGALVMAAIRRSL